MRLKLALGAGAMTGVVAAMQPSLGAQTVTAPVDSQHWDLQGRAQVVEHQGRRSIRLDGGAAVLKNFEMRDAVIEFDVSTPASRGFFGVQFWISSDGSTAEWVYLRQHKSGLPDAMQYTPVLNTGLNWQLYNGPGFTAAVDIPRSEWFHVRMEIAGAESKVFVKDMSRPALVTPDLKSGRQTGEIALAVLTGETYFSNIEVRATDPRPWVRHEPATPRGTITRWQLSPSVDALARDLERMPTLAELRGFAWQSVEAEGPGLVNINRYRESPHPNVSFANDFSKRLDPQPGMRVVYARATVQSDRDVTKRLLLGYSDDVSVFLNGRILYRGRSAQNFRDPGFLGIVNPENDVLYLPLRRGNNELLLAVSELGGGWGFIARLEDVFSR